jgi:putative hemin transport protein
VRKPTSDGHVTSVEAFDDKGELIIQFFAQRIEGSDERLPWRDLVHNLPLFSQTNAA